MDPKVEKRTVIVVFWKYQQHQPFRIYSNLKNFCIDFPEYSYSTLSNYISKKQIPFENEWLRIERIRVIGNEEVRHPPPVEFKKIQAARKGMMSQVDEDAERMLYWLSRPARERLAAVNYLSWQIPGSGERINKRIVRKNKIKKDAVGKRL